MVHHHFFVKICRGLEEQGKAWLLEQQCPTGRYPKMLDLEKVKKFLEEVGAVMFVVVVPIGLSGLVLGAEGCGWQSYWF